MIREFATTDLDRLREIHAANGLPEQCFPDLADPLVLVREVVEHEGAPVMAGFLTGTCEAYLLVDHEAGTPEMRWQWLQELTRRVSRLAWEKGLEQITVWLPPELVDSFEKRLLALGFLRSEWQSYTLPLTGSAKS